MLCAALVVLAACGGESNAQSELARAQPQQQEQDDTPRTDARQDWWCNAAVADPGPHLAPHYPGIKKAQLSEKDCGQLSTSLEAALEYASQWRTVGDAHAAGFHHAGNYVPGWGSHLLALDGFDPTIVAAEDFDRDDPSFPGSPFDAAFDPERPTFLQYAGDEPDSELVGLTWYLRSEGGKPPEGFPGSNDMWHVHESLCIANDSFQVLLDNSSKEECEAASGINVKLGNYWMLHAWVVPGYEYVPDPFGDLHPCLGVDGPADPSDPCWEVAEGIRSAAPPPEDHHGSLDGGHG